MKKTTIIFCLTFLIGLSVKGQFNPIKNLKWSMTYVMPATCFTLKWSKPDTSLTDTLIGYNIYRNDSLYIFTTDTLHSCIAPCIGGQAEQFCGFINYIPYQFYLHVTAVYNQSHIESAYNDSAFCGGYLVGINENLVNETTTISNITQANTSILIEMNNPVVNGEVIISNLLGQEVTVTALKNQRIAEIDISNLSSGLYLLNLRNDRIYLTRKILIK